MRNTGILLAAVLASSSLLLGQSSTSSQPPAGVSIETIDKSVDPCTDFYQYACGNWMKNAQIPGDQPEWASFIEVEERNNLVLKAILEKAQAGGSSRSTLDQKIGDYYGACIDEKAADGKGLDALKPELNRIAAVNDKGGLIDAIARVHLIGPNPLFNFFSSPDLHNADMVIAYIDQGGLTLPDRKYYINDEDAKMVEQRKHLIEYATTLFTLSGQSPQQAAGSAQAVLRIEIALPRLPW